MLALEVGTPDFHQLVLDLAATPTQAQRALNSTLRKMAAWLRARGIKGLSEKARMQQKILRRRLKSAKFKTSPSGSQITLWFGLNPVALIYLGAKQSAGGVTAQGGRYVQGAFIAQKAGGPKQVFKRRGQARLPIDKQESELEHTAERYIERDLLTDAFEMQFWRTFEHELKWQTR